MTDDVTARARAQAYVDAAESMRELYEAFEGNPLTDSQIMAIAKAELVLDKIDFENHALKPFVKAAEGYADEDQKQAYVSGYSDGYDEGQFQAGCTSKTAAEIVKMLDERRAGSIALMDAAKRNGNIDDAAQHLLIVSEIDQIKAAIIAPLQREALSEQSSKEG